MKRKSVFLGLILALVISVPVYATDYDFSGNFQYDNDVLLFNFNVGTESTVTIFSSSWVDGGFDPILGIWDASGALIEIQDDGGNVGSTSSNSVLYNHGEWDSYYSVALAAGSYQASVTQYDNFNNDDTLSAGFNYDGVQYQNFTYTQGYGGATQPYFNGVWDDIDPRTSDWAFHILNVGQANVVGVPEPATMLMLGLGLLGLAGARRFKK